MSQKITNKDGFFNRSKKVNPVTLPDGSTVFVRKLSEKSTQELSQFGSNEKAHEGLRFVVLNTLANENGERLLTDGDADKLREVDFDEIRAISDAAMEFSGLKTPDPKASPPGSPQTSGE